MSSSDDLDIPGPRGVGRRGFLAAGAGAFICSIAGEKVLLARPGDAAKADAAARRTRRPVSLAQAPKTTKDPQGFEPAVDRLTFSEPRPEPGGELREYWVQAVDALWDVIPSRPRRDVWHGRSLPGPSVFRAFTYQEMTTGFAAPKGGAAIPGPLISARAGDLIKVHFRNAISERFAQAVTMHPHGVHYNPEYDGTFLGDFTRLGGFVGPGEEFTYLWEARADSVGVWPYHDHGPNHTLNSFRGLFGAIVVHPRDAKLPDVEHVLFFHQLTPPVTGLKRAYQGVNGRAFAGNTPTIRARVGQDVAVHVIGMDNNFHDFHIHGHRWRKDGDGPLVDTQTMGPNEGITARWVEDNPGRWLYHCHVFSHQDNGMAGFYIAEP